MNGSVMGIDVGNYVQIALSGFLKLKLKQEMPMKLPILKLEMTERNFVLMTKSRS